MSAANKHAVACARPAYRHPIDLRGAARPGNRTELTSIERIAAGKVAEVWVARDGFGLLSQLGVGARRKGCRRVTELGLESPRDAGRVTR